MAETDMGAETIAWFMFGGKRGHWDCRSFICWDFTQFDWLVAQAVIMRRGKRREKI